MTFPTRPRPSWTRNRPASALVPRCTASRVRRILALLGLIPVLTISRGHAEPAQRAVGPEWVVWSDTLQPPEATLPGAVPMRTPSWPDSVVPAARVTLRMGFVPEAPRIDGDLGDWPVVRWHEIRGARSVVRGRWAGPADAALRFAVLWTPEGIVFATRVRDDSLQVADPRAASERDRDPERPAPRQDSVLLSLGSTSPAVRRYWHGRARTIRVWADGSMQGWTRLRRTRVALFDPELLGARAAAHTQVDLDGATLTSELFVPWSVLFPVVPDPRMGIVANVMMEDVDAGDATLLAWSTAAGADNVRRAWARVDFERPPASTPHMPVALATTAIEPGMPVEWAVLGKPGASVRVHERVAGSSAPARIRDAGRLPAGFALLRLVPPERRALWAAERRIEVALEIDGTMRWQGAVWPTPRASAFQDRLETLRHDAGADAFAFPSVADVAVRLERARRAVESIGDWAERLNHESGSPATRAAAWRRVERLLADAADLEATRRERASSPPPSSAFARVVTLPQGKPILRGHRSAMDGSFQPYVLYVPDVDARHLEEPRPLVVILHDFGVSAEALAIPSTILQEARSRNWVVVAPWARGDTGYQGPGERDVLEVLDGVRQGIPIDDERLYVAGSGMGGTGTWTLSLRHPDLFAAAAAVSGYGDLDQQAFFQTLGYHPAELFYFETYNPARLVRPGLETAYAIVHAERDPVVSVMHARIMAAKLQEFDVEHRLWIPATAEHGPAFFAQRFPEVAAFFAAHARRGPGTWSRSWFQGVGGPIASVFARGPVLVVYGTQPLPSEVAPVGEHDRQGKTLTGPEADRRTAEQFCLEWASVFAGRPPMKADADVTPEDLQRFNLVLVGDPRTHRLLARWRDALPVRYDGDRFEVEQRTYPARQFGVLYATGNPDARGRTLVVLSAMGERLGGFRKSLLKLGADFVVTNDMHAIEAIGHWNPLTGPLPRRPLQGGR